MAISPLLVKGAAIALVGIMVTAAIARIEGLVGERRWRGVEAVRSVERSHAAAQTLIGPVLARDCNEEWEETAGTGAERHATTEHAAQHLVQVPATLAVTGRTKAEVRHRGLFKVNSYVAQATAVARFADLQALVPARTHANSRLACGPVTVVAMVDDVRGLRTATATVDGQALAVQPGTGLDHYGHGLHAALPDARAEPARLAEPLVVTLALELVGTGRLAWVPASGETTMTLASDWPHPSFGGQFLPLEHTERTDGFTARWAVSSLATTAPAKVMQGVAPCSTSSAEAPEAEGPQEAYAAAAPGVSPTPAAGAPGCLDTLSVAFIDPVNPYVLSDRAVKYGLLFVALTFLAVGPVEVLSGRRVHPVQYLLVGLALSLFFLLLLSLSEHLSFDVSYLVASGACALLLGFYGSFMLGRWLAGAAFGAGIAALYGLLYALLQMEQDALVIGAVMLFLGLALVMVLTRRVDWHALFVRMGRGDAAAVEAA